MKEFKKLIHFTKGFGLIYVLGIISVIISQGITILNPLVLKTTIDSIIGERAVDSFTVSKIISFLGGRDELRGKLWKIGLIIICIALFRGCFYFLKIHFLVKQQKV